MLYMVLSVYQVWSRSWEVMTSELVLAHLIFFTSYWGAVDNKAGDFTMGLTNAVGDIHTACCGEKNRSGTQPKLTHWQGKISEARDFLNEL